MITIHNTRACNDDYNITRTCDMIIHNNNHDNNDNNTNNNNNHITY